MSSALTLAWLMLLPVAGTVYVLRRLRRNQDEVPAGAAPDGTGERIAVRGLYRRNGMFGGESKNSINPMFAIGADALHFRIFRAASWPFAEIGQVDVRKGMFGDAHVLFLAPGNAKLLAVTVADIGAAKAMLGKLPRAVPLSEDAAMVRDGSAAAATPGLRRYSGPIR